MKAALLTLLTVYVYTVAGGSDSSSTSSPSTSSCSDPPSKSSFLDSAAQFGVLKQWLESNFTRAHQKDASVRVVVYTDTLCPVCKYFLVNMLFPTWMMLNEDMSLTLVPYGNSQETFDGNKYIYKCPQGEEECLGNMIQTCLIKLTGMAFQIIRCMQTAVDTVKAARNDCFELYDPEMSWDTIMSCVNGDLGNQLMHDNALKTKRLETRLRYVPWITINGKHSDVLQYNAQEALFPLICCMIAGPMPPACTGCWRDIRCYSPKLL